MSTSDQDRSGDFAERAQVTVPPGGMPGTAGLPDVALLSRLANEFFRAEPEQGFATSIVPDKPDSRNVIPLFTTRLPEFVMPMPAVPAIPSAGGVPGSPGPSALSMGVT